MATTSPDRSPHNAETSPDEPSRPDPATPEPSGVKFLIEFTPLLVFFLVYLKFGMKPATGALMVATVLSALASWRLLGHVPKMLQITTALVCGFGALTFLFDDPRFIMRKPTVVYLLFAAGLAYGLSSGRNFLGQMLGQAFKLTAPGWHKLTIRWICFFIGMAVLNELLIQAVSEDAWVKFKTFGFLTLTAVFGIAQIGLIKRYSADSSSA